MATLPPDKRPRLRDIVRGNLDDLQRAFEESVKTGGRTTVPSGQYRCLIAKGSVEQASTGTPSYKLVFEAIDGPHTGRKFFHDIWLTEKALRMSGHELARLGFRSLTEISERPLPPGLIADVTVVEQTENDGTTKNVVRRFKLANAGVPADDYSPDPDPVTSEADAGPPDAAGPASTPHPAREPGEDDDRDDGGFDWRSGIQHTSSAPLLDAAGNRNGRPPA
jgi:hypothetical protein